MVEHFDLGRPVGYFRLTIPPMLHYGFQCLGDVPALLANCTDLPHDPAEGEIVSEDIVGVRFPAD
jgi:dTDP-4-dehydrorhamnose 3,5-epimerase